MPQLVLKANNPVPAKPSLDDRGLPVGTRRTWSGIEYVKHGKADWRPAAHGDVTAPEEIDPKDTVAFGEAIVREAERRKEEVSSTGNYALGKEVLEKNKAQKVREKLFETYGKPNEGTSINIDSVLKPMKMNKAEEIQYKQTTQSYRKGLEKVLKITRYSKKISINEKEVVSAPDSLYVKVRIKDNVNTANIRWDDIKENLQDETGCPVAILAGERGEARTRTIVMSYKVSRPYSSKHLTEMPDYKDMLANKTAPCAAVGIAGRKMLQMSLDKHQFMTTQGISGKGKTNGAVHIEREIMSNTSPQELDYFVMNPTGDAGKWNLFKNSPYLASEIQEGGLEQTDEGHAAREKTLNSMEWYISKARKDFDRISAEYAKISGTDVGSIGEFEELRAKVKAWNKDNPNKQVEMPKYHRLVLDELERFSGACNKQQEERLWKLVHQWRNVYRKFGATDHLITQRASNLGEKSKKYTSTDIVGSSSVKMSYQAEAAEGRYLFNLRPSGGQSAIAQAESLVGKRSKGEFAIQIGSESDAQVGKAPFVDLNKDDNEITQACSYMSALYGVKNVYKGKK